MTTILNILLKQSCKLAGLAVLLAMPASSQSWFFNWDGTTDITCVPTVEGNNAFYQGSALRSSTNVTVIANEPYRIRASTNLQDWADLTDFVAGSTNCVLVDSAALSQPRGFYRAVSP